MNILIPHSWLLEHLETDATPEEIQEFLSLSGPSVERIYDREGESVYDIEVTTNRVDAMSVRGIAREASAILPHFGKKGVLKPLQLPTLTPQAPLLPLPEIENDPKLSGRVICVVLKHTKRTPTPDWMAKRLCQIDQNVHDSVIDITNYSTHELGHPCHAFDYDKIMAKGGVIRVIEAEPGEHFETLDGNTFETLGGEVVFKNGEGEIIDLPSIKGTANTSVDDQTQNVLLLMESIKPEKVRFASMSHSIRTVAASLMEKQVDPHLAADVLAHAGGLYQSLCQAEIGSPIFDDFPGDFQPQPITFSNALVYRYLGFQLPASDIEQILTSLGCAVTKTNDGEDQSEWQVTPPTYRPDLVMGADLVEEVARIYGYHAVESKLMDGPLPLNPPAHATFNLEKSVRTYLSLSGCQELFTYSLVSQELALQSGYSLEDHLAVQNPLTDDRVYLRRELAPSLVEGLAQNPERTDLTVFEIANVYQPRPAELPVEVLTLGLASAAGVSVVRGILDGLLHHVRAQNLEVIDQKSQNGVVTGSVQSRTKTGESVTLGSISVLPSGVATATVYLTQLQSVAQSHPTYQPLPKTAIISEELTFTLPPGQPAGVAVQAALQVSETIRSAKISGTYEHNITLHLEYYDPSHNLSSEEIAPLRQAVVSAVTEACQATLVGTL